MPQEHRPIDDTRALILRIVAQSPTPMTRTEIARAIKRKKTPHLINLIDSMVQEGLLSVRIKTFHNGVKGYIYTLARS